MDLHIPADVGTSEFDKAISTNDGALTGRIYQGQAWFETTSLSYWSKIRGVNVVGSRHFPTLWKAWDEQLDAQTATALVAVDEDKIATKTIDLMKDRL